MTIFKKYYGFFENLKIGYKYILSFLKNNWVLEDYPIWLKKQTKAEDNYRWCAKILNWPIMIGLGKTREESLLNLSENFSKFVKKSKGSLPRPGNKVELIFAEDNFISRHSKLLDDFLLRVMEVEKDKILYVSDSTSIYDFTNKDLVDKYNKKIKKIYSVDVSDIKDGNLARILNRIVKKRKP